MVRAYRMTIASFALSSAALTAQPPTIPAPTAATKAPLDLPECPTSIPPGGDRIGLAFPEVGKPNLASVGDRVLVSHPLLIRDQALRLERPFTFSGSIGNSRFVVSIPAGTLRDTDDFGSLKGASPGIYRLGNGTIRFLDANGQPGKPETPKLWMVAREHGKVLHTELKLGSTWVVTDVQDAPISTELCRDTPYKAIEREILYGGVAKGVITLEYREFIDGLARTSFTQEGTFDLAEGKEIAFKGVRLTVLEASNTGLRYIVTQAFGE